MGEIVQEGVAVQPHESTLPAIRDDVAPATVERLSARLSLIRAAMEAEMVEGKDYGKVAGVTKPTLYKPGAEKLCVLFRFDAQPQTERMFTDDGHLDVWCRVTIFEQTTGARIAAGEGMCSTRETKYALVQMAKTCPVCKGEFVKLSKKKKGEWYCWAKIGGCGANFDPGSDEALEIEGQETGRRARTPNELADTWNTVLKMAVKRAHVAAVLMATGASEIFTQDVEEMKPETVKAHEDYGPPAIPVPRDWSQIKAALAPYGDDVAEAFGFYVRQAAGIKFGTEVLEELPQQVRAVDLGRLAARACVLFQEGSDPGGFPPPNRAALETAWAAALDGVVLAGPPFRMGPEDEGMPTYAEWKDEQEREAAVADKEGFAEAVAAADAEDIPFGEG